MGGVVHSVLACCRCVGHQRALPFRPSFGCRSLLAWPARYGVLRPLLCLGPPGRPVGQVEYWFAPGVLGCTVAGMMLIDEGARDRKHLKLRLEAWGKVW